MIDIAKIGVDTASVLGNATAQSLFDYVTGLVGDKRGILERARDTIIEIPLLATDDIPRNIVMDIAKATEIKVAWDVKKFIEGIIKKGSEGLSFEDIIRSLPIATMDKRSPSFSDHLTDVAADKIVSRVSDATGKTYTDNMKTFSEAELASYEIKSAAIRYAKPAYDKAFYSEAAAGSPIVPDLAANATHVQVEMKYIPDNGRGKVETITYFIGVQCKPRFVDSVELATRISSYDPRRLYKRFVMLDRGEISFIKQFLLDIEMIDRKAKSEAGRHSKNDILNVIDRYNLTSDAGITVYPFASMLVSSDFVNKLQKTENFDLKEEAKAVMTKFFTMAMYIYNPAADVVDVRYDGDNQFSSYALSDVTKETSKYEQQLKQLIKFNR